MTDEQRLAFQHSHGEAWAKIIQSEAFSAGMIHLSVKALNDIRLLTDEQITGNSVVILANLRGMLRHESQLFDLPIVQEDTGIPDLPTEYPDQIDELFEEHQRLNTKTT